MKFAVKNRERKRRYKVSFIREGEPKIRHLDYLWATSATEAERLIKEKRGKLGGEIIQIRAGALR